LVVAPGSSPDQWPATMANLFLLDRIYFSDAYTTNGKSVEVSKTLAWSLRSKPPPIGADSARQPITL